MTGAARTSRSAISSFALALFVSAALAGCGGGDGGDSSASTTSPASGSSTSPSPSPFPSPGTSDPQPTPAPGPAPASGNQAPQIKGTPSTFATVNVKYSFSPTATDADNDALGFSIANKPSWATFNTATGVLSGTPTQAQTYANIVITVNDGNTSVSLPAFSIAVSPPDVPGTVTLTWDPPTENEDGSALQDLAGYTIVYGPSSTQLHESVQLSQPGLYRYVFDSLPAGTYYFAVKAFTATGTQSRLSNVVSKVVK